MQRIARAYFGALNVIAVLCLTGMVVLVFGNAALRYGFDSGITVSEEVARLLFVYMTFCGAIVAMRERLHLGTDLLISRLPRAGRKVCYIVSHALMLFATVLFLKGSWQQALINLDVKTPVTGVSMAVFYGVGVLFCVSVGLMLIGDLARALTGRLSDDELIGVRESEQVVPGERREAAPATTNGSPAAASGLQERAA